MTALQDELDKIKEADIWIQFWKEERDHAINRAAAIINKKR